MLKEARYNSQAFLPEEVEAGLLDALLDYFKTCNKLSKDHFIEAKITSDGLCTIVYWINRPYSDEWGGSFEFVDEGQSVMKQVVLPDDSYEFIYADEDEQEYIEQWKRDHEVADDEEEDN